jgi:hypothetical protein
MPRRRRGASAVAIESDAGRGLVMRILLYSPKDMVAGALAFAAVTAIVANALFLQAGRHPAPLFGTVVVMPPVPTAASPLPRPRPADAAIPEPKPVESKATEPRAAEPRTADPRPADPRSADSKAADLKTADPMTNLVKATSAAPVVPSAIPRPPASIPAGSDLVAATGSHRVAAVQRALTEYGYGQLKPTGTVGTDTQAAIQKFERARKLPVTGQVSERLVRELTAVIGHPID